MIVDLLIAPRASGKTTWAKQLATDNGWDYYSAGFPHHENHINSKIIASTKPGTHFVIDEIFHASNPLLYSILIYNRHFYHLTGTPMRPWGYYEPAFIAAISEQFPEFFI